MGGFKYNRIIYPIIGLTPLLYIGFLTNGIPFFWCDFDLFHHALSLSTSFTKLFYPGPVTVLITKIVYTVFGLDINIFRFFKDILFLTGTLLVARCVYRISGHRLSSIFAGLFFMVGPSVLKSTMWICDSELLTQVFLILAFLCYIKVIKAPGVYRIILFVTFLFLANQTTNGGRFFAIAMALDLFLAKDMPWIRRLVLLSVLFLIGIFGTGFPSNTAQYSFALPNIKEQFSYLIRTDSYIVGVSFILSLFWLWRTKDRMLRLSCFWFWSTLISQLFYQRTDFQFAYQVIIFAPLVITLFSGLSLCSASLSKNKAVILGPIAGFLILLVIFGNLMLSNHYRGAWGSLFIAMGKVTDYMDKNITQSLIVYQSATPNFQSFLNKNRYLNTQSLDTTEELEVKLHDEIKKGNYKNVYLVSHTPDVLKPIDKIQKKKLIIALEGKSNYLYDRLKQIYRIKTGSADTPNQFILYLYNK